MEGFSNNLLSEHCKSEVMNKNDFIDSTLFIFVEFLVTR